MPPLTIGRSGTSPWRQVVASALAATCIVILLVLAFTWPTKTSSAKNLPIGVVGSDDAVSNMERTLNERSPGTFDLVAASDREEAERQIHQRQTYGAIILSDSTRPAAPEILTAPAASPAVSQMLDAMATQLTAQMEERSLQAQRAQLESVASSDSEQAQAAQAQLQLIDVQIAQAQATQVTVTPVVPNLSSDSTGSGLAVSAFPLVIGGMIGGVLLALSVRGSSRRVVAALIYASVCALALGLVLHTWFGFVGGNFALVVLAFAMSILATTSFVLGAFALLGYGGIALGVLVTMFIGNPISGASAPWQFIPEPWGAVGQYMVPGASTSLIRSISAFPQASTAQQWWTLAAWIGVGLLMGAVGHARSRKTDAGSDDGTVAGDPTNGGSASSEPPSKAEARGMAESQKDDGNAKAEALAD
ncbi:MAG: ABC transporter permease [Actinomycetaceae bacterium]|nr:ABC transporter permease [Actinomycetaceae bacterium]